MAEEVKLYGASPSPYSRRVELALKLKGVPFEYVEEDLKKKSPELLRYNPVHKMIPVLVHNGNPISESLVILEYIDETWPTPPIMPRDPYDRAKVRFWAEFVEEKVVPTAMGVFKAKNPEEQDQANEETRQQLKFLEDELKGKDFFGGDSIGYLDIVVFYMIYLFQASKEVVGEIVVEEKLPLLCKLVQKLLTMEVVKECLPPLDQHTAKIKAKKAEVQTAEASKQE